MKNRNINDKYIVDSLIGTGGMAVVYKGTRIDTGEMVAIKMLKNEYLENSDFVKMFNKESTISLQITHTNIVNTIDVGMYENCPYIIMEYIQGLTLKEYIKQKIVLTETETLQIALQLCDALIYAHQMNLVHRDIKPQNVLLREDGVAKIGDFGIAKMTSSSTITMSGSSVIGSVHYMSPEQAMGHHVGDTTDIYSLGIVMFEMLTGSVPFKGDSPVTIALKHVNEDILSPKSINPNISDSVNKIILKATDKSQEFRYSSAETMRSDIENALLNKSGDFVVDNEMMGTTRQHSVITKDMLDKVYQGTEHIKTGDTSGAGASSDIDDAAHPNSRSNVFKYYVSIFAFIITLTVIVLFVQFGQPQMTPEATDELVSVPELVGLSLDEATRILKVLGVDHDINYVTDEAIAADMIVDQTPLANQQIDSNIHVTLFVSKGADLLNVPSISNMYFTEAISVIEEAGFAVGDVSQEVSTAPVNYVTRQLPKADTAIPQGEKIHIWLSTKSDTANIMPNIVGQSFENAMYLMSALDTDADNIAMEYINSGYDKGTVVNQEPAMDTVLSLGLPIKLYISNGEGEKYTVEKKILVTLYKDTNNLVIVYTDDEANQVVYDEVLTKGDHEIVLNLMSNTPGEKELTIYCDGEEQSKDRVIFEVIE